MSNTIDTSTAKGRVQLELKELSEKNEKLGVLIGKIKSDNFPAHQKLLSSLSNEQKKLLKDQYSVQKKYIRILEKRLKIWTEEK